MGKQVRQPLLVLLNCNKDLEISKGNENAHCGLYLKSPFHQHARINKYKNSLDLKRASNTVRHWQMLHAPFVNLVTADPCHHLPAPGIKVNAQVALYFCFGT